MKISAVIITKNEENMIVDAIDSVSFCDEIVIIDNDSQDRTRDIAGRLGANVFSLETNDFSKLRNYGKEKAKSDWIIYVDADERVSEELVKEIKNVINKHDKYAAYRLPRKNFYLGKNAWPRIEKMERLFKKEFLVEWAGKLHESPKVDGEVGELSSHLFHYTHQDLSSMLNKTIEWSEIEAANRIDAGHPKMSWWRFPRVMVGTFLNYYIKQKGFKLGTAGIIESIYQSFSSFITYAKLWEKQNKSG